MNGDSENNEMPSGKCIHHLNSFSSHYCTVHTQKNVITTAFKRYTHHHVSHAYVLSLSASTLGAISW